MENMPEKPIINSRKKKRPSGTRIYYRLLHILFAVMICAVAYIVYVALQSGIGLPVSKEGQAVLYVNSAPTDEPTQLEEPTESTQESTEPTEPSTTEPVEEPLEPSELASLYMENMTLEELVWQMMFVTMDQLDAQDGYQYPVGGVYFRSEDMVDAELLKDELFSVQAMAQIPVMFGVTHEGGQVAPLTELGLVEATDSQHAYGDAADTEKVYEVGLLLGEQIAQTGFHFNLAPVADTFNWYPRDEMNMDSRTFGTNEDVASGLTQQMVAQMVKGMQDGGTIACLKHFPNFGSTAPSDNDDFSWLTYEKFSATDFLPFAAGIEAGAQMVLVSDMIAPNLTDGLYIPCCRAKEVVTDILRTELGFEGVILTDDQSDQTNVANIVAAVQAGCDVIYLPADAKAAVDAILAAVENGTLSQEQIEKSAYRILLLKCESGIITEE